MWFWLTIALLLWGIWFCAMLASAHFRFVSNEVWANYVISFCKAVWPLAAVVAAYCVFANGYLAAVFRAASVQ